jgi:hypothetical protein
MVKFSLVVCTKHDSEMFKATPIYKSAVKLGISDSLYVFYENKKGLSYCYNAFLATCKTEYAVFVHDDVYIMDSMFNEKLELGFKNFNVLGVAGSSDLSLSRLPLTWINSPKESWSGGLYHSISNGVDDLCDMKINSYGHFNRKCVTVDGVLMAVKVGALNGVKFQEEFEFDFYDMAFCLECYMKQIPVGTIPLAICHMSHGAGIMKPEYNVVQDRFLKKYKKG